MRRLAIIICICLVATVSIAGRRGGLSPTLPFQFGIWSDNTTGTAPVLLVEDQLHEISHVHVSPDGTKIAWTRWNVYDPTVGFYTENSSVAGAETFIADINGANKKSLGFNTLNHGNSAWAPDNSGLYFNSNANPCGNKDGINFYNLSTKVTTTVLYDSVTPCRIAYGDPTVTGAGAGTILVVGGADTFTANAQSFLYTYNLSTLALAQLNTPSIPSFPANGPGPGDFDPKFNHAGTYIATNRHVGKNCYHIVVTKLSDGTWTDLTDAGQACPTPSGTLAINGNPEFNKTDDTIDYWHIDSNPVNKGIWTIPFVGGAPTHVPVALAIPPNGLLKMPTWDPITAGTIYYSSFNITLPNLAPAPTNTVVPTITASSFTIGQTITASTGSWAGCGTCTYTYLFYREGFSQGIRGAGNTYTLTAADLGARFSVDVVATNSTGVSSPALSLVSAPIISTTARYVANAGNDTWDGTAPVFVSGTTGPWATLAHANVALGSGNLTNPTSVLLNRGDTFREQLVPTYIGTSANHLVFDAYGTGAAPNIQDSVAAATAGDWTLISGSLWKSTTTFEPAQLYSVSFSNSGGNLLVTANSWPLITPKNGRGIVFASSGTLPGGINAHQGYWIINVSGSTFNITATPPAILPISCPCPNAVAFSSIGTGTQTAGINGQPGNQANDVGNLIWTAAGVTQAGTSTLTMWKGQSDGNLATLGDWYFSIADWRVHVFSAGNPSSTMPNLELAIDKVGVYLKNEHFVTIQNMTVQYTAGTAINFLQSTDLAARDLTIRWIGGGNANGDNIRYGDALDIELTANPANDVFERNLVSQCFDAGPSIQPLIAGDPISNVTFRNNIIQNGTQGTTALIISGAVVSNVSYYNNTSYNVVGWSENQRWDPNSGTQAGQRFGLYHSGVSPAPINYNNENNAYTFLGASCSIAGTVGGYYDWTAAGKMLLDYNLWSRQDGTAPTYCASPAQESLQTWANGSSTGQEAHGLIGTAPSFTSPSTGNFTPTADSPLRNAGTNLFSLGVVWDFNRLPRPKAGNFTIGAIQ